jgi:hypothetical protein
VIRLARCPAAFALGRRMPHRPLYSDKRGFSLSRSGWARHFRRSVCRASRTSLVWSRGTEDLFCNRRDLHSWESRGPDHDGAPCLLCDGARSAYFSPVLRQVHPRYGTPAAAILLQTVLAGLLIAVGTFEQIVAYFFFVSLLFLAMSVAAIVVLRKRGGAELSVPYARVIRSLLPYSSQVSASSLSCWRYETHGSPRWG